MSSLPAASLRSLPPDDDSEDSATSSKQALLSRSVPRRHYSSTSGGGGSLVAPVIGDDEVEVDLLRRSRDSLDRRRARSAASALQDEDKSFSEGDWYHIANENRRQDHLTR